MPFFKRKSDKGATHSRSTSVSSITSKSSNEQPNGSAGNHTEYDVWSADGAPVAEGKADVRPKTLLLAADSVDGDKEEEYERLSHLKAETPVQTSSRLSKTLHEILHDKDALPYFISYMEAKKVGHLIKFWLDVESFQASTWMRLRTSAVRQNLMKSRSSSLNSNENKSRSDSQGSATDETFNQAFSSERTNKVIDSVSCSGFSSASMCSASGNTITSDNPVHASSSSHASEAKKDVSTPDSCNAGHGPLKSPTVSHKNCDSSSSTWAAPAPTTSAAPTPVSSVPSSVSSSLSADPAQSADNVQSSSPASEGSISDPSTTHSQTSTSEDTSDPKQQSSEENFMDKMHKSIAQDAVNIYQTYISQDCKTPIGVSEELRNETVTKICREDGHVDPHSFQNCQDFVVERMNKEHFANFLQSEYHCKHQIDVLTGSQVYLADILYNESSLFYFMEFMEQEGALSILQCFLDLDNFQQHLSQQSSYDGNEAQNDAMVIYEKYFSLQATTPLGFNDKTRFDVESNICREAGPLPDCFAVPKHQVLKTIDKKYFHSFLTSEMYYKYLSDMITTVQSAMDIPAYTKKRRGSDSNSEHSLGSQGSHTTVDTISSKNTLLASGHVSAKEKKKVFKIEENDMRIDEKLFNPDALWKRDQAGKMSLGKIDEFGCFHTGFEPEPDHDKKKIGFFKLLKEDKQSQEDMAAQIAKKIIEDINKVTLTGDKDSDGDSS